MNAAEQWPVIEAPPARIAPVWGIAGIVSLLAVLGVVVQQRLSEDDRSWTRWEKHELTGPVLGQSPEAPAAPAQASPARRSSVPPMWSKSETSRPESSRSPRELGGAAPAQNEGAVAATNDPFASPASAVQGANQNRLEEPRKLFSGDLTEVKGAPIQPEPRRVQGNAKSINDPNVTPASLDFAVSGAPKGTASEQHSAHFQRVRQVAGTEGEDANFAEPLTFGAEIPSSSPEPTPARGRQMMQNSAPQLSPVSGQQSEMGALPAVEPQGQLPEIGQLAPQSSPTPIPVAKPATPPLGFSEPQLEDLQPLANPPVQPPVQPQPTPRGLPSLEMGLPAQSPNPVQAPLRQETSLPTAPAADPFMGTSQSVQPNMNEPVPSVGLPQQSAAPQVSNVPAQRPVKPDEVYQVQNGDNYWTISRRFYSSARFFSALAEYNKHRIPSPEKMKPGMYVLVPDVEVLHQRYPQLTGGGPRDPAETAPPGFFVDANGQPCYRVGKGDTLSDIAQAYLGRSSRWVQIQALNRDKLSDGQPLRIGLVLKLPADASQVVLAPADSDVR